MFKFLFAISISLFNLFNNANAQVDESSDLFKKILAYDHIIFEKGFNQCLLKEMSTVVDNDFEFYHDVGGFQKKQDFMLAMKNNICSSPEKKPIRKLVSGSLKVFELKKNGEIYGAIQEGIHEFYIQEPATALYKTGIARFTQLWLLKEAEWKLSRVLSYDHKEDQ